MRRSRALRSLALLTLAALSGACMFKVNHELPPGAYFGTLAPAADEVEESFDRGGMKNWALAGLVPYSRFSSSDLLAKQTDTSNARIENLEIETRFGTLDTIIWVVPGFFYGYYLWAPRTVAVRGTRVDESPEAPEARWASPS